jgi:hypothetical protein
LDPASAAALAAAAAGLPLVPPPPLPPPPPSPPRYYRKSMPVADALMRRRFAAAAAAAEQEAASSLVMCNTLVRNESLRDLADRTRVNFVAHAAAKAKGDASSVAPPPVMLGLERSEDIYTALPEAPLVYRRNFFQFFMRGTTRKRPSLDKMHPLKLAALAVGVAPVTYSPTDIPGFLYAAATGDARTVSRFLAAGGPVNATEGQENRSALHIAAMEGQELVVRALLKADAARGRRDRGGWTELHHAAAAKDSGIVAALLDTFAAEIAALQAAQGEGGGGGSAEGARAGGGPEPSDLRPLDSSVLLYVNAASYEKRDSPLTLAASAGSVAVVGALLKAGARVDQPDALGYFPLHHAAFRGGVALVRALLVAGARTDAKNAAGERPVDLATVRSVAAS